jgi:hypothetical protein
LYSEDEAVTSTETSIRLHGVTFQKIIIFIFTTMRTSNPTSFDFTFSFRLKYFRVFTLVPFFFLIFVVLGYIPQTFN